MAITFSRSYLASDGKCYGTLDEAQQIELVNKFGLSEEAAKIIVHEKDNIVDLLTLTDSSRPAARGKSKPRKPKIAQPELPNAA